MLRIHKSPEGRTTSLEGIVRGKRFPIAIVFILGIMVLLISSTLYYKEVDESTDLLYAIPGHWSPEIVVPEGVTFVEYVSGDGFSR